MNTINVVAAVIKHKDKIFATQRGYGEFKGGWEFPGGKVESGEEPEAALIREIQEELNGGALDLILEESDIQVVDLTEEERAAFKEKALTAYDKYKELVGQDGAAILDKLLEEVAAVNAE